MNQKNLVEFVVFFIQKIGQSIFTAQQGASNPVV
jgi:hypothetical protein